MFFLASPIPTPTYMSITKHFSTARVFTVWRRHCQTDICRRWDCLAESSPLNQRNWESSWTQIYKGFYLVRSNWGDKTARLTPPTFWSFFGCFFFFLVGWGFFSLQMSVNLIKIPQEGKKKFFPLVSLPRTISWQEFWPEKDLVDESWKILCFRKGVHL